jgi:hypothetical protein
MEAEVQRLAGHLLLDSTTRGELNMTKDFEIVQEYPEQNLCIYVYNVIPSLISVVCLQNVDM